MSKFYLEASLKTVWIVSGAFLLATFLSLGATGQPKTDADVRQLPAEQTLKQKIIGLESHRYKVGLQKDDFAQITVEQDGVSVTVRLADSNNKTLVMANNQKNQEVRKILSFVAAVAGDYFLDVSSVDPKGREGNYTIQRSAGRYATENDRKQANDARGMTGNWSLIISGPQGSLEVSFVIEQAGETWSGSGHVPVGEIKVFGTVSKQYQFSATATLDMKGKALTGKLEGTVEGYKMKGSITPAVHGLPRLEFIGERSN